MLPTIDWQDDVIVMVDQRKLPGQEVYVRCQTAPEVAQRDPDDGDSRRAGDRRGGGDGHRARHAAAARRKGTKQFAVEFKKTVRPDGRRRGRRRSTCSGRSIG